jgi:hypothetical protein
MATEEPLSATDAAAPDDGYVSDEALEVNLVSRRDRASDDESDGEADSGAPAKAEAAPQPADEEHDEDEDEDEDEDGSEFEDAESGSEDDVPSGNQKGKKAAQPFDVPTSGMFYQHDDRFEEGEEPPAKTK